ncbi:hypothetical protein Tasa_041_035 [Tanticharoenia sakaeratensis NBRC 103193]|uniref:Uncharacterized protein n=1 Tax=Tanticharoenia sakaeratensis NBRC 103193 TaxID=1231623 RepID=A0A0D6MPE2_9PROT|nr:hypothetical protein Tasa_041_035 [Tanticharoenia sakaeratensis NBRC 103193]
MLKYPAFKRLRDNNLSSYPEHPSHEQTIAHHPRTTPIASQTQRLSRYVCGDDEWLLLSLPSSSFPRISKTVFYPKRTHTHFDRVWNSAQKRHDPQASIYAIA